MFFLRVKVILNVNRSRGKLFYLVEWNGFSPEERSQEPAEYINATALSSDVTFFRIIERVAIKEGGWVLSHRR